MDLFAKVQGSQTPAQFPIEFRELAGAELVVFFQKPQCLADDLASRIVTARTYLRADEFFQFRRERNIHSDPRFQPSPYRK